MSRRHFFGRSAPQTNRPHKVLAVERLESRDVPSSLAVVGPLTLPQQSSPSTATSNGREFTSAGGTVYLNATTSSTGSELFRMDGSTLSLAADISSGPLSSNPRNLVAAGNNLFFIATDSAGDSLYMATTSVATGSGSKSILTTTATRVPGSPSDVAKIAAIGRDVFMITKSEIGLLRTAYDSNGSITAVSITDISDPNNNQVADDLYDLKDIAAVNGRIVLTRESTADDASLIQVCPGIDDSASARFSGRVLTVTGATKISNLTPVGESLYFHASTTAGSVLTVASPNGAITPLLPAGVTSVGPLRAVNSFVYFAGTQSGRTELWRTDGTASGTSFYLDINGQTSSSLDPIAGLQNAAVLDNTLFLAADFAQAAGRTQPFSNPRAFPIPDATGTSTVTNGTVASTVVVSQDYSINSVRVRVNLTHPTLSNLKLELSSPTGQSITLFDGQGFAGDNLVNTVFDDNSVTSVTGGVAPFTGSFKPLNPLSVLAGESSKGTWTLTVTDKVTGDSGTLNNWTLEVVPRALQGTELGALKFDLAGNRVNTTVFDLAPGTIGADPLRQIPRSSSPTNLIVVDGRLYFSADIPQGTTDKRTDLWTSDGTASGTFMVSSPVSGATLGSPTTLTKVGNDLYFNAGTLPNNGSYRLSANYTYTSGLVSPNLAPTPGSLTALNQEAYFIVDGDFYTSDGTTAGTRATSSTQPAYAAIGNMLVAYNNSLIFFTADGIYKTDGTDAGTPALPSAPVPQGVTLGDPRVVGRFNGRLQIADGSNLLEYDGSSLRLVTSTFATALAGRGPALAALNGNLVYASDDPTDPGLKSVDPISFSKTSVFATSDDVQNIIATDGGIVFLLGNADLVGASRIVFSRGSGTPITLYQTSADEMIPGSFAFSNGSILFNSQVGTSIVPKVIRLVNPSTDSNGASIGFTVATVADTSTGASSTKLSLANTENGLQFAGEALSFNGAKTNAGIIISLAGYQSTTQAKIATGKEPWIITPDGGLKLLRDISPNPAYPGTNIDSDPAQFTLGNGVIYFSADDVSGREMYRYDINSETVIQLLDVNTNYGISSNPGDLSVSGNSFFWTAEPSSFNTRLYADLPDPIIHPIGSIKRLDPTNEVITSTGTTPIATFMVHFNKPVDPGSVNIADFILDKTAGLAAGTIIAVNQANAGLQDYTVKVDLSGANPGSGVLGLKVSSSAIFSYAGSNLDNFGGFQSGETYVVNPPRPVITSLTPNSPTVAGTTNSANVSYLAMFSTSVDPTTVNSSDFDVATTGSLVAGSASVVPTGTGSTSFIVTIPMVSGQGTVSLSLKSNPTILTFENQPYDTSAPTVTSAPFSIDLVRPLLAQVNRQSPSSSDLGQGTATFAAKFSEAVNPSTVNSTSTFRSNLGSIQGVAQASADTWLVTVSGLPNSGTLSLSLNPFAAVTDLYGNVIDTTIAPAPNQTYTINPAPQLLSVIAVTPANPLANSVTFAATFSKLLDATSVNASDFILVTTGNVTGSITSATVNANGDAVTITVTGVRGSGTITVNTAVGASITDTFGNNLVPPSVPPALGSFVLDPPVATLLNKPLLLAQANPAGTNLIEVRRGLATTTLAPFPSNYRGGVVAASGDFNGDGVSDTIAVARQGAGGRVVVFDGVTDQVISTFFAFPGFSGPLSVASGDYNGDGTAEIAVAVAGKGPAIVKVFSFNNPLPIASWNALPGYSGGVSLAMADVTGDGKADVITGTLGNTIARVRVFSQGSLVQDFRPLDLRFRAPILVTAGDMDGDGKAEIIVAGGPSAPPTITIFSGARAGQAIGSVFALPSSSRAGLTVAVADHDGDGKLDIYTSAASGPSSLVKVFNGRSFRQVDSFFSLLSGPIRLS
mgnify:CR=1 FL=1